jgi:hypothetical protein
MSKDMHPDTRPVTFHQQNVLVLLESVGIDVGNRAGASVIHARSLPHVVDLGRGKAALVRPGLVFPVVPLLEHAFAGGGSRIRLRERNTNPSKYRNTFHDSEHYDTPSIDENSMASDLNRLKPRFLLHATAPESVTNQEGLCEPLK